MGKLGLWRKVAAGMAGLTVSATLVAATGPGASAKTTTPTVRYVGTIAGYPTPAADTYSSIQAAVNAANKGDWILVAPGDYHETDDISSPPPPSQASIGWFGGVDIETSDIHLRGMNRNSVIVDGTNATASVPCSSAQSDQNLGYNGEGRNGILVWQANGVTVDNLTVCNFLSGSDPSGNEVWWDGGNPSKIGLKGYEGSYLTATSTYFASSESPSQPGYDLRVCSLCAQYGIFASHAKGPATLSQLYGSNMSDSGVYVGACSKACGVTIDSATMEYNALGYSGTNSGGQIIVQNSTFDNNKDGFDTNTALSGDLPPPQDGRCPGNKPLPGSVQVPGSNPPVYSCWVFQHNVVEDNNNPNVPIVGTASLGPTGTGMTISGGRYDTVTGNTFSGNDAWGILFVPYPESYASYAGKTCKKTGGITVNLLGYNCFYDPMGNALVDNNFSGNATLANPSNADFGNLVLGGHEEQNCFVGNTDGAGAATDASVTDGFISQSPTSCGVRTTKTGFLGAITDGTLLAQAECDAGVLSCSSTYGTVTGVVMQPLPGASSLTDPSSTDLASMPDPCSGLPAGTVWCPGGVSVIAP